MKNLMRLFSILILMQISQAVWSLSLGFEGGKQKANAPFIKVNTLHAIDRELARARKENKRVLLEFSASWCSDCQALDRVFNHPEVVKAMSGLINLKVDISNNNHEVATIRKAFAIYGIPTLLFFDSNGRPLNALTVVGFIDKPAMLRLLHKAISRS